MVKVAVLGGGTAGAEAATEAAERGAEVTIIERLEGPDPPWSLWPSLINSRPGDQSSPSGRTPFPSSVDVWNATASWAKSCTVTTSQGLKSEFDRLISCTGSTFAPPPFRGSRKRGVRILDTWRSYAGLAESCSSAEDLGVAGEGYRLLAVADALSTRARKMNLMATHWLREAPSPPMLAVLKGAAQSRGLSMSEGTLSRALGSDVLEAVTFNDRVARCDFLAFTPSRVPRVIPTGGQPGPGGGLLVDDHLRTTTEGTFAAGGCAELPDCLGLPAALDVEAGVSGRIAGSNCAGDVAVMRRTRFRHAAAFGLRFAAVGLGARSCSLARIRFETVSHKWDEYSACTILFERQTERVLGIELVEPAQAQTTVLPLASGFSLRSLAYGGLGSSDISLLSDTARLGLRPWQRS